MVCASSVNTGGKKRKGAGGGAGPASDDHHSQFLLGPKAFPLQRMLAIHASIFLSMGSGGNDDDDESMIDKKNLYHITTSLVYAKLLYMVSADNNLDSKYKCNISHETASALAKNLRIDLSRFLYS